MRPAITSVIRSTSIRTHPIWALTVAVLAAVGIATLSLPLAFGMVLLATLVVLTFLQPLIGVGVALIAGPLGAYENVVLGNLPLESGQLFFFGAVAGWMVRGVIRGRVHIHRSPLNIPLTLFILIAALSLLDAVSLAFGIKELVKWLELAIAMLMVMDLTLETGDGTRSSGGKAGTFANQKALRGVLAILLAAGISQALIGIWQFGLSGDGPDHFIILERFYRAFGTFMQPNPFGGFMGISASLALGSSVGIAMVYLRKKRSILREPLSEWLWIAFVGLSAMLTSLALLMSWSRGAWLGFAAAMAVLAFFFPKRRWVGVVALVIAGGLLLFALQFNIIPQSLLDRATALGADLQLSDVRGEYVTIENYALVERLAHWQAGMEMARDNLLTGVGFGGYERAYEDYALLNWPIALGHAHNYYINLLAEVGAAGVVAYVLLWAVVFIQAIRLLQQREWPERGIALGLLAAWTAISVHHFFDKLYVNNMFIYFGVMLGLQQILDRQND